ncbi:hypothetical protein Ndes2437B_g03076 [Nannochloris sp. 'desiccata']
MAAVALLPSPVLALRAQQPADIAHLAALPKPSTIPFGLRLAIADSTDTYSTSTVALTLTWSTTAPLTHPACVLLFDPTSTAQDVAQKKYQHQDKTNGLPYFSRRTQSTSHRATAGNQVNELGSNNDNPNPILICGSSSTFIEPATQQAAHFIHTVLLDNLETNGIRGRKYQYKCGNDVDGWSTLRSFTPPPPPGRSTSDGGSDTGSTNFLLLGDMGVAHARTLPYLIKDALNGTGDNSSSRKSQSSEFSALVHVGDIAYDLHHYQGRKGQHFLRMIEPISSSIPYMVAPGNHEAAYNFSHYRSLFKMPQYNISQNLYYSFDMGLIHIVVYNSEVFFWPESYGIEQMRAMFEWLESDLEIASKNRKRVPWVMAIGHRPMYCSSSIPHVSTPLSSVVQTSFSAINSTTSDTSYSSRNLNSSPWCGWEAEASRRGIPSICPHNNPRWCHRAPGFTRGNASTASGSSGARSERLASSATFPIEELFKKYSVDLFVAGHVHDYERYWPVYNYTYSSYGNKETGILQESISFVEGSENTAPAFIYKNPNATVHIISGAGGNTEMRIGPGLPPQGPCSADTPWCAFQSGHAPTPEQGYDFSYSRVFVHNASHLQWQQYSATFERVIDEFWVVQEGDNR